MGRSATETKDIKKVRQILFSLWRVLLAFVLEKQKLTNEVLIPPPPFYFLKSTDFIRTKCWFLNKL